MNVSGVLKTSRLSRVKCGECSERAGRLLSGIPISDIGHYTREDTRAIDARAEAPIEIMPFGKYKGNRIADIPLDYRQWMIRSFEWNARNEKLRKSILTTL